MRLPVWITENGLADADDAERAGFLLQHLAVLQGAIADGVPVIGYTFWSLIDNLAWATGYGPKFGLYSYDPVTLERTAKAGLAVGHQIVVANEISASVLGTLL